jgi:predicted DNA-binding ArsR family transcriptional regulator
LTGKTALCFNFFGIIRKFGGIKMAMFKSAEEVFQSIERNFMTPIALSYYEAGIYAIELSQGTGVHNEPIFGVSVLKRDRSETYKDPETESLSKLLHSQEEAKVYIRGIKRRSAILEICRASK